MARWNRCDAGNGNGRKRKLPCNWADGGCVAPFGQHHVAGNGADFPLLLKLETLEEPMTEAEQMATAQPVGAASHTRLVNSPSPCEIGSKYRVGLSCFESGRVLVFAEAGIR